MKTSTFALTILIASFLLAIFSTIFIHPITASGLVCTAMIFQSYRRIKHREDTARINDITQLGGES